MINKRLATIAKSIQQSSLVVDVGTDHALLPIYLVKNQLAQHVIGVEMNHGPFLKAKNNVAASGLDKQIEIREGDGLDPVLNDNIDVIVIAGMGGRTIVDILQKGSALLKQVKKLVLQPMNGSELVRSYLADNKYLKISDEDLIIENDRLYEFIIAEPGQSEEHDDILMEIGPVLYAKKHPLFPLLLEGKIRQYREIADSLDKSDKVTDKGKMEYYIAKANRIEKVMVLCL